MEYQPSVERYDRMQYKNCGNSGLLLPRISLGLWHNFGSVDDFGIASDMIKYAFDNGVTHFDLANNYGPVPGSAETNFGKILKENFRGYRDEMIISSKAGHEMWAGTLRRQQLTQKSDGKYRTESPSHGFGIF